jgi:CRP-like cAMP-binding protein
MSLNLEKIDLVQELSAEQQDVFADLLTARCFRPGETLFRRTDEAAELFLITEGSIRLELKGRVLGELRTGEAIGAVSLVVVGERQCDAIAIETTRVLALSRESYLRLRVETPSVALALQEGVLRAFASLLRTTICDRRGASVGGA